MVQNLAWDTNIQNPWQPISARGYYIWEDGLNHYTEYVLFEQFRGQKIQASKNSPNYWKGVEFSDLNSIHDKKSFLEDEREVSTGNSVVLKIRSNLGICNV